MEQASALWTYIIGVAWNSHRSGVPYACNKPRHWWYFTNDSVSVANQPTHNAKDPISGIPGGDDVPCS